MYINGPKMELALKRQEHTNLVVALQEARAKVTKAKEIARRLGLAEQVAEYDQIFALLSSQIHDVNTLISRLQSQQTYVGVAEM